MVALLSQKCSDLLMWSGSGYINYTINKIEIGIALTKMMMFMSRCFDTESKIRS